MILAKLRKFLTQPRYSCFLVGRKVRLGVLRLLYSEPGMTSLKLAHPFSREQVLGALKSVYRPLFLIDDQKPPQGLDPDSYVEAADSIRRHEFNLLGSGPIQLGDEIDWNLDPISGERWDNEFITQVKLKQGGGSDIKQVWELSRFQFAAQLGQTYLLTDDERYPAKFVKLVSNWIAENRPYHGPNWLCPMEVGIRVCNWILGWSLMKSSSVIDDEFHLKFLTSLQQQGRFIRANLEKNPLVTGNHYLANLAGLAYIGVMFPELRESRNWVDFSVREFESEVFLQVYDDGVSFEGSVPYHRLALELILYPALLFHLNNIPVEPHVWHRLEMMLEFTASYINPNGIAPQIGDNDSGRLHILSSGSTSQNDHRYLLHLASRLFPKNPAFSPFRERSDESDWLAATPVEIEGPSEGIPQTSVGFEMGQIYILKNRRFHCLVDMGPVGLNGIGAHAHNDCLSFVLTVDGHEFIIDPGTGHYNRDAAIRNRFRSTAYHNTIVVDNVEINEFDPANIFMLKEPETPQVTDWETSEKFDILIGHHAGYKRFKDPVTHQRSIRLDKIESTLKISDRIECQHRHNLEWNIPFHPEVTANVSNNATIVLKRGNCRVIVRIEWDAQIEIIASDYSPEYGVIQPSTKARIRSECDGATEHLWRIETA